jgi:hypothetical protein
MTQVAFLLLFFREVYLSVSARPAASVLAVRKALRQCLRKPPRREHKKPDILSCVLLYLLLLKKTEDREDLIYAK